MSIEYVIQRAVSNVRERLFACGVTELVYAAALFGADPEALFANEITLGLERDRVAALAYDDPEFLAAQEAVLEPPGAAWDALGEEPQRYMLNRIAARVTAQHPLPSVTDDFVVYAFAEDFGEEPLPHDPASLPGPPGP